MSVFPAYSALENPAGSTQHNNENNSWLKNSSFQVNLPNISEIPVSQEATVPNSNIATSGTELPSSKKRKKKLKKSRTKKKLSQKPVENDLFKVDHSGARELLSVRTISRPSAPIYKIAYWIDDPNLKKVNRSRRFKRYHKYIGVDLKVDDEVILTNANINKLGFGPRDENFAGFKEESELSEKTGYYNGRLADKPDDIKMWLEYVHFQDTIHQFEKSYRKGSMAKAQRVLGERKLSILDKALSLNPSSEILHRERLNVAVLSFPSDELQIYLKDLVEKDKSNVILWQGYIEATQCSMSHCNTPAVLNLYTKCLSTLHQLRRATSLERHLLEECILKMLYQCGLFLKQAGLLEQLWTLLRMYLELNLSPNDSSRFNIFSEFSETQLVELEEVIFKSNLPLHELWLRTEKLREACHWLPYAKNDNCEDPQRMIFTEDVAQLIHPITMPENIFKLTATIFSLLKIPLLPCRHSTMGYLGLDYVPWSLDSIEPLLAMFFPLFPVNTSRDLWNNARLAVGPQYLKKMPGHEEYLSFLMRLMENSAKCLTGDDKIAVTVWYFRFQRVLIILEKNKLFVMTEQFKKTIRKTFKDFLKLEENRQNEIYYLEYALAEFEFGNVDNCIKIINTALRLNDKVSIAVTDASKTQKNWCHLYRHLIQLHIKHVRGLNEDAIQLLCKMSLQQTNVEVSEEVLQKAEIQFHTITRRLIDSEKSGLSCIDHFLPDFLTDWVMCHGWFILLSKSPNDCFVFMADILQKLEESEQGISWQKEVLYEFYVALLFKCSTELAGYENFKLLDAVLHTAIELYPNNVFMLSVLEKQQTIGNSLGLRWWKVKKLLLKSDRAISSLFAIIIVNQQIDRLQEIACDNVTGAKYEVNAGLKNRMLSLFKMITSGTNSRKCGLIWRLYLQFVYTYFAPEICRNVYYSAVEECPWLKALYMDAAIYIPAELTQIQDLIIEKQLRLHVTPEELDVLRSFFFGTYKLCPNKMSKQLKNHRPLTEAELAH